MTIMSLKMESPATPLQTHKFQAQNSHPFSEPARYGPHQPPPSAAQEPSGPGLSSDPTHALSNPPVAHTNGNTAPLSPVHSANNAVNGVNASPASHSTQNVAGVNSTPVSVPTATPVNKERTRHSSACFPCAKRKVKCDRDVKNPCSNCLKRDQGHLCEVKSQKDRLSHGRNGLAQDGHRDKRPKFEAYQSTFRSTPAATNGYLSQQDGEHMAMSPPQARMQQDYGHPDYRIPRAQRTSVSMVRKSDDDARWEAIEELLPPRKDLLKYIGTYRIGPHVMSPVNRNLDAIESQACMLLEELGTPLIRQRLCNNTTGSEAELTRLARLLAVLAAGSRVEDVDPAVQRMVAQDYVRKSFKCLQLANYMLRPTTETVETLFVLAQELTNEYQPGLAWTTFASASRLVQLREPSGGPYENGHYENGASTLSADQGVSIAIALQDTILSLILGRATPSTIHALKQHSHDAPKLGLEMSASLIDLYTSVPDPTVSPASSSYPSTPDRWSAAAARHSPRLWPDALQSFHSRLDSIMRNFRLAELSSCKSIRDRYEHYVFRLHYSFVLATVQRTALPERAVFEPQDYPAARQLEAILQDTLRAFLDFSSISNLPVRTWWMCHLALDAALELCCISPSADGVFLSQLLPRLLQVLEGGGVGLLSKRHQEAVGYCGRVLQELERERGERGVLHEEAKRDFISMRAGLGGNDDYAQGALVMQAFYGL